MVASDSGMARIPRLATEGSGGLPLAYCANSRAGWRRNRRAKSLRELALLCKPTDHKPVVLLNRLTDTLPREELRTLFTGARKLRAKCRVINQSTNGGSERVCVSWLYQDSVPLTPHHAAISVYVRTDDWCAS